ncbi:MAG: SH3 domain-containing protein [Polyangiaceae bacterium]|nr:SH3 domain-containing protein [Polyangiaceae bacterium]
MTSLPDLPDARERRSLTLRRATDQLTVLALVGALAVLVVVGLPVVVRGLAPSAVAARRGIDRAMRERGWAVAPVAEDAPPAGFEGLADPDPPRRLPMPPGHPAVVPPEPGGPSADLPRKRAADPLDDEEDLTIGVARQAAPLLAQPRAGAPQLGEVRAGDAVVVVQEATGWLLVIRSTSEGEAMGWVERSKVKLP